MSLTRHQGLYSKKSREKITAGFARDGVNRSLTLELE
jgi:hypothetical protein